MAVLLGTILFQREVPMGMSPTHLIATVWLAEPSAHFGTKAPANYPESSGSSKKCTQLPDLNTKAAGEGERDREDQQRNTLTCTIQRFKGAAGLKSTELPCLCTPAVPGHRLGPQPAPLAEVRPPGQSKGSQRVLRGRKGTGLRCSFLAVQFPFSHHQKSEARFLVPSCRPLS